MKFKCEKETLEKTFSLARRATPNRSGTNPVLSGLHVELKKNKLVVLGSDLDLTIRIELEVGGEEDGKAVARMTEITAAELPSDGVLIDVAYSGLNYKDGLALNGNLGRVSPPGPRGVSIG